MSIVTEPKRTGQAPKRPSSQREAARQARAAEQPSRLRQFAAYRDKLIFGLILAAGLVLVVYAVVTVASGFGQADQPLIYYTVQRGDLPITVTERGNLESQDNIEVLCELDDIRGDNIDGTPILWIIPNGSSVKKDELLVELDSAGHRERLDIQILDTERTRADQIQAKAQHDNQISQNETMYAEAELQVKLAELELKMFTDEENGTHQLEVEEINRLIDDVNNEILAAQANLELKRNEKLGIESLFKLGYAGKSEMDRSRLDFLQAESQYAAKTNRQKTQLSMLAKKETYEREMQLLQLKGNVATAKRNLDQAELNNAALLEQAKAAMVAADRSLKKSWKGWRATRSS